MTLDQKLSEIEERNKQAALEMYYSLNGQTSFSPKYDPDKRDLLRENKKLLEALRKAVGQRDKCYDSFETCPQKALDQMKEQHAQELLAILEGK